MNVGVVQRHVPGGRTWLTFVAVDELWKWGEAGSGESRAGASLWTGFLRAGSRGLQTSRASCDATEGSAPGA